MRVRFMFLQICSSSDNRSINGTELIVCITEGIYFGYDKGKKGTQ